MLLLCFTSVPYIATFAHTQAGMFASCTLLLCPTGENVCTKELLCYCKEIFRDLEADILSVLLSHYTSISNVNQRRLGNC